MGIGSHCLARRVSYPLTSQSGIYGIHQLQNPCVLVHVFPACIPNVIKQARYFALLGSWPTVIGRHQYFGAFVGWR
jgi:hypothetical protein